MVVRRLLHYVLLCSLVVLSGCFYQSDEQVLQQAEETYRVMSARHADVLDAVDDDVTIANARRFGMGYRTGSFWYAAYLDDAEVAPLHRALNIIRDDVQAIRRHMGRLDARLFASTRIFEKLVQLKDDLLYVLPLVKGEDAYVDEARALQARELQRAQLAEAERQTCLLTGLACAAATPVVYEERVITRAKPTCCAPCRSAVRCVANTRCVCRKPEVKRCEQAHQCKPCKKKKPTSKRVVNCAQTTFNTDDVSRGGAVIV